MASQGRPPQGTVFGVVLGFAAGVLATALIAPGSNSSPSGPSSANAAGLLAVTSSAPGEAGAQDPADVGQPAAPEASTVGTGSNPVTSGPAAPAPGAGPVASRVPAGAQRSTTSAKKGSSPTRAGSTTGAKPTAGTQTVGGPAGVTRGVTDKDITIGVAYPDLSTLKTLGPEYDNGDVQAQWKAWHDGLVQQGILPINGRDILLKYATYNVTDTTDQNNACRTLVEDDGAFAVIGVAYFEVGSSCVAQQEKTPLLTPDGPSDAAMAAGTPNLYSLSVSDSKMLRNMIVWADQRGALKGKKIGVYYANDSVNSSEAQTQVVGTLQKLGYSVASSDSTGQTLGGPEDGIAAQKFMGAGVNLAILLTSETGFQQQAKALGYKPTFIDSDHAFGTSDVATSTYPSDEYDGTYGITGTIHGEAAAGIAPSSGAEACIKNYENQTKTTVTRPGNGGHTSAVYSYILNSCDLGKVLVTALQRAGKNLGQTSLVNGIRTIDKMPLTNYSPVTFTGRPDGGTLQRTVQWSAGCTCWKALGSYAPFPAN